MKKLSDAGWWWVIGIAVLALISFIIWGG